MSERSFEESIKQLEEIVRKLEDQNTTLDEAMKLFETGVALSNDCAAKLENAKQAVNVLLERDGKMEKVEFEENE